MTNHWVDIKNADLILVMGGNPAEAHPCGFKWVIEAKKTRKAKLVVVDPRFNRTASVAAYYAPLRSGPHTASPGGKAASPACRSRHSAQAAAASAASSRPRHSLSMMQGKREPHSPPSRHMATVDSSECSSTS